MMNEIDESNIPTLTEIIQLGDASMKNHFDATVFDHDTSETDKDHEIETETLTTEQLKDTIDNLIQQAMDDTLPAIEAQLKEKLTEQILLKLSKN